MAALDVPACTSLFAYDDLNPSLRYYVNKAIKDANDSSPSPPSLVAKESLLTGAGDGLFVTRTFERGECLCEYYGDVLRTASAIRLHDKSYLMRLGPQVYVDARERKDVLARFINDCRNPKKYNVQFVKLPHHKRALVLALRQIRAGEEVYVDYGKFYWVGQKPFKLTS